MAMQADQIMRSSLNDIIFEGRNKSYGAYALRKTYERHLMRAMIISFVVFLLGVFMPRILEMFSPKEEVVTREIVTRVTELGPPPSLENKPPPPKIELPPPPKTVKFTPPVIVKDEEVKEVVPTIKELKEAPVITSGPSTEGPVVYELPPTAVFQEVIEEEDPNKVFTVVEETPEYPGGLNAMYNFINKNIRYPSAAQQAGIDGRVFVSFVLNKEGEVTNVRVDKGVGAGLDEEAMRVVKLLKGFTPAKQAGRPVNYRYVLPIKFKLQ